MITAEDLGPQVPRRGNAFTQRLGEFWLRRLGWTIEGEFPNEARAVFIGAPHTSNRDGLVAAATILALRLKIRVMAKAELFKGPLGPLFRWLGVMPVYRSQAGGLVEQSAAYLQQAERFYLGIAPEGTRHGASDFKRGFYHIAVKAGVPIVPFILDFGRQQLRITPAFYPTGNVEADMAAIIERYRGAVGANPDRMSAPLKAMLPRE